MKTKSIYYIILFVYTLLWACQLVVCHMTHSLIVLTDSYINLYKILDISLGLLHLCTQREVQARNRLGGQPQDIKGQAQAASDKPILAGRLFDCLCTYQFKRLPLLGSFMNGLFLAALLMSAAIEGIQTCVHSSHVSQSALHDQSILHRDRLTFPLILAGFALVGLIMQHCSLKAHEMREEELHSESLLDISATKTKRHASSKPTDNFVKIKELNASNLGQSHDSHHNQSSFSLSSSSSSSGKRRSYDLNALQRQSSVASNARRLGSSRQASLQELPMSLAEREIPNNRESRISLKSLKFAVQLESIAPPIGSISHDLEAPLGQQQRVKSGAHSSSSSSSNKDNWFLVRFLTSPLVLIIYSLINYFVWDEVLTEVFDASLSICVVFLLFAASYPPMKKAGRVLLQTAPEGVDLVELEKELLAASKHILEVKNLHVWSLTPRSNRVATCELLLDSAQVINEKQIELIVSEAKFKFLDQNIKCTTIEPVLKSPSCDEQHQREHQH